MVEKEKVIETLRQAIESGPGWVASWVNIPELGVKIDPQDWVKIEKEFEEALRKWNSTWVLPVLSELERLEKEV